MAGEDIGKITARSKPSALLKMVEDGLRSADSVEIPFGEYKTKKTNFVDFLDKFSGKYSCETRSIPYLDGNEVVKYKYSLIVRRKI
ncbi:MAG: hypothetical protein KKF50_00430 [Nanoarchaeota archaeon]|nr:hypothetical protein [Nanoarchaeota archaeon]